MKTTLLLLTVVFCSSSASALQASSSTKPIQDNSFLIEEAYNQEYGVVQHISAFRRDRGGDWTYTFTQEWPAPGVKHQLSFTLPIQSITASAGRNRGVGDLAINYRYQLTGDGDAKIAVAPRFSLLVPTGAEERGLGSGGVGYQVNVPASIVLHDRIVTHWNAGTTYTPSARNTGGDKASSLGYNLGQSIIYQLSSRFNIMLETAWDSSEEVIGRDLKQRENSLFLNPGVRWAHNFKSGLQIVPGIAVPLGVGPSKGDRGVFIYLSFEHPFRKI